MSLQNDVMFLRQLDLFQAFDDDQIKLVAFNAGKRSFPKGKTLFRQGDKASGALIVTDGTVALERHGADGTIEEGEVGPGTILGELALVCDVERHLGAVAQSDTTAIEIPRMVFRRLLDEYPDIAVAMHEKLATRLASATTDLAALGTRFSAAANM